MLVMYHFSVGYTYMATQNRQCCVSLLWLLQQNKQSVMQQRMLKPLMAHSFTEIIETLQPFSVKERN